MNTNLKFDFDDINLVPRYSIVDSRSECDTSIKFGKYRFKNPVMPANMESVINEELSIKLSQEGYFYVMHRFNFDSKSFIKKMKELNLVSSISIGVNEDSYNLLTELKNENIIPDYVTIDIAHGHSKKMKRMIKFIKENFGDDIFIIAGNVSSIEATVDLDKWGADAIKVGVGPGSACTTWPTTGFGSRNIQASIVNQCASVTKKHIICDGGIRNPGDISKSIVLGSTMVMVGGMLSAFLDSPGRIVEIDDVKYKEFYGSASSRQSNKTSRIEGMVKLNKMKNSTLVEYMEYLSECLQSSISYGGGNKLTDLYSVKWI
jgi:GMP reductase